MGVLYSRELIRLVAAPAQDHSGHGEHHAQDDKGQERYGQLDQHLIHFYDPRTKINELSKLINELSKLYVQ